MLHHPRGIGRVAERPRGGRSPCHLRVTASHPRTPLHSPCCRHYALPRTGSSYLVLYGERRRQGDVAHFCDKRAASVALQGFQLAVCVVDIAHGAQHDISRGATDFWIPLIRQGRIVAIGAAPPCEIWAIARWADGGWHQRDNPVFLKAEPCLWGKKELTQREHRQIRTANVL